MRYRKQQVDTNPRSVPNLFIGRASVASYINAGGVVRYAAIDEPRYGPQGLIVEDASTNWLPGSQGDMALWNGAQAVSTNTATAPDGTNTAATTNSSGSTRYATTAQAVAGGVRQVASFFYRPANPALSQVVQVTGLLGPGGASRTYSVNITPGTGGVAPDGDTTGGLVVLANGWYRLWAAFTPDVSNVANVHLYPQNSNVNAWWGFQLEQGVVPSSYIPTMLTPMTRQADQFFPARVDTTTLDDYIFTGFSQFYVDTPEAVAQAVRTRLRLSAGEWFLDDRVGFDLAKVLGNNTAPTRDLEVKRVIAGTPGVTEIVEYASQVSPERRFTVSCTVNTQYGRASITEVF